ncbi:uncharacterized protein LOC127872201 [Dreissena polymorpha]|uniref:uncharacterized protein LOC127872201 n=1 Tax=Dreissena polymorpha TaxID=45954 RepID=UPI002264386C|nr:uncharacterized protein LOC127872201 [Dreissena polymorpha]
MALTCCVQNCSKGAYWLNKWKKQLCDVCGCLHKERDCKCDPPFRLFTFPTKKKNPEQREKWKQLVGRRQGSGQLWSPGKDSRVCSDHFTDGEPTKNNPLPTVSMGYDEAEKRAKRMIQFEATSTKHTKRRRKMCSKDNDHVSWENLDATPIYDDPEVELLSHTYKLPWSVNFLAVFVALCLQISEQNKQIAKLKAEVCIQRQKIDRLKNTVYSEEILKTDDDVQFYTGLANKSLFNKLHGFISPFVTRRWTGVMSMAKNVRKFKSTLSAHQKLIEKAALKRLNQQSNEFGLLPKYQSAYRPDHSCESALLRVVNDILAGMERQEVTALIAIDLSAAFDTVDHDVLLEVLRCQYGVSGTALDWVGSYLRPRGCRVSINGTLSSCRALDCSVPQGSCLGPWMYLAYAGTLFDVIPPSIALYGFADDHIASKCFRPSSSNEADTIREVEHSAIVINDWMNKNKLKMNTSKTEFIMFGSRKQLNKCATQTIDIAGDTSTGVLKRTPDTVYIQSHRHEVR